MPNELERFLLNLDKEKREKLFKWLCSRSDQDVTISILEIIDPKCEMLAA